MGGPRSPFKTAAATGELSPHVDVLRKLKAGHDRCAGKLLHAGWALHHGTNDLRASHA